jgi:2-keto-4-pentenoate hydratase/2-oxohepta-3-ene-1,7-dioic acid hydratase in catechol pathway
MRILTTQDGVARREPDGSTWLLAGSSDLGSWFATYGSATVGELARARRERQIDLASCGWANAVVRSQRVWGVGLNYRSKVAVTGRTPPDEPTLFLRSSVTGARPGGATPLPLMSRCADFEGELAIVIGRELGPGGPSAGWDAVAFVTTANDMTARDIMKRTGNATLAKSFPGFGPIGPELVTPDEFAEPDDLELQTLVNDEVRQSDRTSGMIHSVPAIVSLLTRYSCLMPGDVVLTGSPAGAGDDDGRYLEPGDVVSVRLADLEPLVSTMDG